MVFVTFKLALHHLNRLYYTHAGTREYNPDGVHIFEEEWDNLLILDACRYDMFERALVDSGLCGTLSKRTSRGSNTEEFLDANVAGADLLDTVYVTANPMFERHADRLDTRFHAVINVWQEEGWDEEHNTVLPETITDYASEAAEQYPHKRLLVHYIQPHFPFIGSDVGFGATIPDPQDQGFDLWTQLRLGDLSTPAETIWEAYDANLELTLPHIERFVRTHGGKTVVTADHGNMIGERSFPFPIEEWGHPAGLYTPELVTVPWFECEYKSRKDVVAEPSTEEDTHSDERLVTERLENLGYMG